MSRLGLLSPRILAVLKTISPWILHPRSWMFHHVLHFFINCDTFRVVFLAKTHRQDIWCSFLVLRPSLFFPSFNVECVFWFWVGRSKTEKKNAKIKLERSLKLGGPVPQHNILGAWKQKGVVTKSTWWQWRKENRRRNC